MTQTSSPKKEVMVTMDTVARESAIPFLRGIRGEYAGYEIPVHPTGILLGRSATACNLVFRQTTEVSRYHCRVAYDRRTGYFIVTDLRSQNGIYTENGQRLASGEKLVLAPGQSFMMCGSGTAFQTFVKLKT